jgi:WD40 repeat protein
MRRGNIIRAGRRGERLLLGGKNGSLRMTKSGDGDIVWEAKAGEGVVDRVAFSADGALAIAGMKSLGGSADVVVFGTGDGGERLRIAQRSGTAFAFDRDASLLATAASDAIEVARVADGQVVRRIVLPETLRTVRHIAFSADGTRISAVAGSYASIFLGAGFFTEQAIFVWDAASGGLLDRLPAAVDTASDYTSTLRENDREYFGDIAWSGDGRFVAALVFEDRLSYWAMPPDVTTAELRVWDLGGGSSVETYRARTAPEERLLAIDDSGGLLFTVGDVLRVKDTDVSRLLEDVCQRVRRDLTPAEWRDHVSAEERQRPSCPARPARR